MDTCVSLINVHRRSSIGKAKKRKKRPALDAPITSRLNDEDRHRRTGAVPSNVAPGPRDSASLESALAPVSIITSSANAMGLDGMTIETLTSGPPAQARWMIDGTPLDFQFTVGRHGLHRLPDEVLVSGDTAASELLVFGEQDFAEGGGARPWLCVREGDGSVYGFDAEREEPMF